jgi:hypothetical protein
MRRSAHASILALAAAAAVCGGRAAIASPPVVLNEVFYDATGSDTGLAFIELVNTTDATVSLFGWQLEAGDGADSERWRELWGGGPTDAIPPHGRYLVGEALVVPAPDRMTHLELENGPDAVRLIAPDGSIDVLGYGALTNLDQFEGRPAPDVPAGFALARIPDGHDTDDNAADFVAVSPPTPGAANLPERDVAWANAAPVAERIEAGERLAFAGVAVERGAAALAVGEVEAQLWVAPPDDAGEPPGPLATDSLVARTTLERELAPGDSVAVALVFVPDRPGAWRVTIALRTLDDGVLGNDRVARVVQVGAGALLLSEIAHAPEDGPEWVELWNRTLRPIALEGWQIEDASGHRGLVHVAGVSAFDVPPDSLVVVTSDPTAFREVHGEVAPGRVAACASWPALNNGTSTAPEAERVRLRAPDGRVSDEASVPGGVPDGATRERRSLARPGSEASNWGWSAVFGGTPARANSIGGPDVAGVDLAVAPGRVVRGRGQNVVVRYRTGLERARVKLEVYDVRGRPRRVLLDGDAPGAAGVAFDGADDAGAALAPGLYLLALEARADDGTAFLRRRAWVGVE